MTISSLNLDSIIQMTISSLILDSITPVVKNYITVELRKRQYVLVLKAHKLKHICRKIDGQFFYTCAFRIKDS